MYVNCSFQVLNTVVLILVPQQQEKREIWKVLLGRDHKVEVVVFSSESDILRSDSLLLKTTVPGNTDAWQGAVESRQQRSPKSWGPRGTQRSKSQGRTIQI